MAHKKIKKPPQQLSAVDDLEFARRKYTREWSVSSAHLAEQGGYDWMARQLGISGLILEVGCGSGISTAALVKIGNRVISVEENPACIRAAKQHLENLGHKVNVYLRGTIDLISGDIYKISYAKIKPLKENYDVTIIEGNIFDDVFLRDFVNSLRFDGVVCWLIGTHTAMGKNTLVSKRGISTQKHYRILLQNEVYELSDPILKTGGILHIVDRGEPLSTPELRKDFLDSHREQASVTTLVPFESLDFRYEEATGPGSMQMVMSPGTRSATSYDSLALISVRSIKPDAMGTGD